MFQGSRPKQKLCRTANEKLLHSAKVGKPPSGLTFGKKSPGKQSDFTVEHIERNPHHFDSAWTAAADRDFCQNNDNNGLFVDQSFCQKLS